MKGAVSVLDAKAATRYRCECGTEYLVALQADQDESWLEAVGAAALALGLKAVDGSLPTFVCADCGAWHGRTNDAPGLAQLMADRARVASRR
mgnify:CR=1 FL=1